MALSLRILLDTNILIPLQDSLVALEPNLAHVMRLALGRHQLLYHPASVRDIQRDNDAARRARTLLRLQQYVPLNEGPACPWNNVPGLSDNDKCDNSILYALYRDAAHVLITEDRRLHQKAAVHGLANRVYFIQTAEYWLGRLHEPAAIEVPNIAEIELNELTDLLGDAFFDSFRVLYPNFENWFREKAREGRRAWMYQHGQHQRLAALCIYAAQDNEIINDQGLRLAGRALKLCSFKVGQEVRGRKIGELFLKAAFRYATANACENIFIDVRESEYPELSRLLLDFGFAPTGQRNNDTVYVKAHPSNAPIADPTLPDAFEYTRRFYPHYRADIAIQKFVVPIQPRYHRLIYPDYPGNDDAAPRPHAAHLGNAIKLAYLSGSPSGQIRRGDIVLFYRTHDEQAITTLVIVEEFVTLDSPDDIASLVSRRTVYSEADIVAMANAAAERRNGIGVRVMLFRTIEHLARPVSRQRLSQLGVRSPIQSTRRIDDDTFSRILRAAGR